MDQPATHTYHGIEDDESPLIPVEGKKAKKEREKNEKAETARLKKQEKLDKQARKKEDAEQETLTKTAQKTVALQAIKTKSNNLANTRIAVYMNVGSWTGGQTTFGMVSGKDVVLCSWLPKQPNMLRHKGDSIKLFDGERAEDTPLLLAEPIATFLEEARESGLAGSGPWLIARYVAPGNFKFLDDDDHVMLFFPDMHINLFKGFPLDGFRRPHPEGGSVTLARDLANILTFVKDFKAAHGDINLEVWSLGDLYECWHTQGMLVQGFKRYMGHNSPIYVKSRKNSVEAAGQWKESDHSTAWGALEDYSQRTDVNWKTPKGYLDTKGFTEEQQYIFKNRNLNPVNQAALEAAIRDFYRSDGLTPELWQILTANYIRGNHDMAAVTPYLSMLFDEGVDFKEAKKDRRVKGGPWIHVDDEGLTNPIYGAESANGFVRWEHGHAFDWYNHCKSFHRFDTRSKVEKTAMINEAGLPGGWWATVTGAVKPAFIASNEGRGTIPHPLDNLAFSGVKKLGDHFGDTVLEVFSERRAVWIFEHKPDVKLVVMGHTHVAHLEDFTGVAEEVFEAPNEQLSVEGGRSLSDEDDDEQSEQPLINH